MTRITENIKDFGRDPPGIPQKQVKKGIKSGSRNQHEPRAATDKPRAKGKPPGLAIVP